MSVAKTITKSLPFIFTFAFTLLFSSFSGLAQVEPVFESQVDTTESYEVAPAFFGFSPGLGLFRRSASDGIPGKTFHRANFNGGLTLLTGKIEEFTFKTGLEINFFRSAYVNDTSYYEEFLTVPFLFQFGSFQNEANDRFVTIHAGLAISLSAGNGYAGAFDEVYTKEDEQFLDYAKVSGLIEFARYFRQSTGFSAVGMRFSADLMTGESLEGKALKPQQYLMATFFVSFLFGK